MNPIIRTGGSLLIIAAVAAAALGCVNSVTAPTIAEKDAQTKQKAMKAVFADKSDASDDAVNALTIEFEDEIPVNDSEIINSYSKGVDGGKDAGYAFSVTTKGFSAGLNLMIGINSEGTVTGVKVVSHSETPGLGANAQNVLSPQFDGGVKKTPLTVRKGSGASESEISAITGATITSNAVTNAVNEVAEYYEKNLKGGNS